MKIFFNIYLFDFQNLFQQRNKSASTAIFSPSLHVFSALTRVFSPLMPVSYPFRPSISPLHPIFSPLQRAISPLQPVFCPLRRAPRLFLGISQQISGYEGRGLGTGKGRCHQLSITVSNRIALLGDGRGKI